MSIHVDIHPRHGSFLAEVETINSDLVTLNIDINGNRFTIYGGAAHHEALAQTADLLNSAFGKPSGPAVLPDAYAEAAE